MKSIVKRFGTFEALQGVSLQVEHGTLHALVGENGAGKTTLMRVLYGALKPDEGEVLIDGSPVKFKNAAAGIAAGIGMVSQHYSIIPELTCLQNLMLGAEGGIAIDSKSAEARAKTLADRMGFQFDWSALAETLSPAQAQKLEILKLLWRNAKIMILDEPTAMLSPQDSDQLYESLQKLAHEGATVIVVTHKLPEVLDYCQDVTVLRGGRLIEAKPVSNTNTDELAELIVGHAVSAPPTLTEVKASTNALEVIDLIARGHRGDHAVKNASFEVRQGEVLGIAGVDGSGQRELFWALMGVLKPLNGRIKLFGHELTFATTAQRIAEGVRLIPEDRHEEGVVDGWSLTENSMLGLQRLSTFREGWRLKKQERAAATQQTAELFQTKHSGLHQPMQSLSGGNQQRFVAARALIHEPKLILAFQPTRGLDIEATRQVYDGIRAQCAKGAAALVVSFDMDELLENCDRVVAMCGGTLREPAAGEERDRAAIGRLMVGA